MASCGFGTGPNSSDSNRWTHAPGVRLLTTVVRERADREPCAANGLANLCGGLPLALRIVTERLVSQPALCLATLVEELDDECARLAALSALGPEANVRTVFSWSYRQIDGIEAAVFRAVDLGPGRGFDAATIAAIAGRSHDSVERALAHLDRAHLVTDLGNRRYGMHDLLHAYASEVARADHDPHPAEARPALPATTRRRSETAAVALTGICPQTTNKAAAQKIRLPN